MTDFDRSRFEEIPEGASRLPRIFATLFVLIAIAFWLFAFSPWARDVFTAPDQLEDEALVAELEQRCAAARAEIDALPAASTAASPEARAPVVRAATAALENMIADIGAISPSIDDDGRLVSLWVADWEIYLADRARHADRLISEGDVRFLNTEDNGIFVHERMDGFARVNDLDSCETPGDL